MAYIRIGDAQQGNDSHLGGHAAKAKSLLDQGQRRASSRCRLRGPESAGSSLLGPSLGRSSLGRSSSGCSADDPPNLSGTWTIYAYNVSRPGSSLKTIQIVQQGNIISGELPRA